MTDNGPIRMSTEDHRMHDGDGSQGEQEFDTSSLQEFVTYYEQESLSPATRHRFASIQDRVLRSAKDGRLKAPFTVLDIGCGAGTQCLMWAEKGHRAIGLDVNAGLIEIAKQRAQNAHLDIRYDVGSATALPYGTASVDICLIPELLEHVQEWQSCVREAIRILRPGGILFLSTNNYLCPVQHEFNLPLYSWYPRPLKKYFERLAVTTRPDLANHARYPAVHWFSYCGLSKFLRTEGMITYDRFDLVDIDTLGLAKRAVIRLARSHLGFRFVGQMFTPSTIVFAVKN